MGGARVTTLVTLRKCTLGNKREIKTLKFVSASTKGFKGGLAWIKPSRKDMAVTSSYSLDLQGAASPMEVEGELPDMNAEEMAKEGFYLVKSVLRHRYRQGWHFLTLWEGFRVEEATWEPFSAFVLPEGRLNSVLVDYLSQNNLGELLRLAETLASKTKAGD